MANGLRVEASLAGFLGRCGMTVENPLFRNAQAVGHCG
jgi:hypothetical protein